MNIKENVAKMPAEIVFLKAHEDDELATKDWVVGILLVVLMFCGIVGMRKGNLLFLFYVAGTVCVLLLYPEQYQGRRYLTPIAPFYIFLTIQGAVTLVRGVVWAVSKLAGVSIPAYLFEAASAIVLAAALIPLHKESLKEHERTAKIRSWSASVNSDVNYRNFLQAAEWCADSLSDTARIISRKPEVFYMYSKYHKCGGFPKYCEVDSMYRKLVADSTQYMVVDNWFKHAYTTLYPVVQKYPEKFKMVKQFGEVDTVKKINPCYIFYFNDEWGYHGDRVDGKKEGKGYELFQNGRKYVGEFHDNGVNGYGELYDSTGTLLAKGIWKDGRLIRMR